MAIVDISQVVRDYIHEGKQFGSDKKSAILTVGRIGRVAAAGALDFGGSEYAEAEVSWIEPQKQSADDKYGWWKLSPGEYRVELNESLYPPQGSQALLLFHPWTEAVAAGVHHPSEVISTERSPLLTHISVGPQGLSIKENARISQVTLLT
jgi:hypothetical protein